MEGLHEYDSALSDMSPKGSDKVRNRCMEFAGKARAILDGPEGIVTPIQSYYVGLIEQECRFNHDTLLTCV